MGDCFPVTILVVMGVVLVFEFVFVGNLFPWLLPFFVWFSVLLLGIFFVGVLLFGGIRDGF